MQAAVAALRGELRSREAEIAELKRARMHASAADVGDADGGGEAGTRVTELAVPAAVVAAAAAAAAAAAPVLTCLASGAAPSQAGEGRRGRAARGHGRALRHVPRSFAISVGKWDTPLLHTPVANPHTHANARPYLCGKANLGQPSCS